MNSRDRSECSSFVKSLDSIYTTLFNFKHCNANGDHNNDEEDSFEMDDMVVVVLSIMPFHHFTAPQVTHLPSPFTKEVHIEVIPPPPLQFA